MSPQIRRLVLFVALAASAGLAVYGNRTSKEKSDVVEAMPASRTEAHGKAEDGARKPPVEILKIVSRAPSGGDPANAFAAHNWAPPPPPPPTPSSQQHMASTTALPFTFLGKQLLDGAWMVFLGRQEDTYIVKAGDAIDKSYRVESIAPPIMTITYLPLKQQQTIVIGDP